MSDTFLASLRPALEVSVANALKRKAISNRGSFAPFRVPATAQTLVAHLLRAEGPASTQAARALGTDLGQAGLGLTALHEAQNAVLGLIARSEGATPETLDHVIGYFREVVEALVTADAAELAR